MTGESIDALQDESTDTMPTTSINTDRPEAGKSALTNLNNGKVVLGDPKGRACNTSNPFNYKQGAAIPVGIAVVLNAGLEHRRTLGNYNRPDQFYTNRSAIRPPAIQQEDFELKPKYFSFIGQHPFNGLPHENPMDHIENLEDLVSSIKVCGVSKDYLFCKLFPHSLAGDMTYWLKRLQPGSMTCWSDIKSSFSTFFSLMCKPRS